MSQNTRKENDKIEVNVNGVSKMKKSGSNHGVMKVIGVIVGLILVVLVGVVIRYASSINNFLNKVTEKKPEVKQYNVLVIKESKYEKLEDLSGKNLGFLKIDEKAGNAEQYLLEKIPYEANFYEDMDTLLSVISGEIVDGLVLETDRIEMMREEAEAAVEELKVIYTFDIEIASENMEVVEKKVTEEPFIIYLSGSDSRTGIKTTARSDVNIIAVVNPEQGKILLVSIPRDTYVQLHGTTGIKDKLTHAGVYGINMSKTTIEDFLGINIDYTVKVSFDTVVKVVDEIGGIEIDSDQAMTLSASGAAGGKCSYTVGVQTVDGACALRFARERKSYTAGDRHRGENQMQVISSIIAKFASSRGYILNIPTILDVAADSFETTFTRDEIMAFVRKQLNEGTNWQVESISIDGAGSMQGTYSMGANRPLYVMLAYPESVSKVQEKISEYLGK